MRRLKLVHPTADDASRGNPLDASEFAARMAALAPFEPAPQMAVAVSGGPDSLATAYLLDEWCRARGGAVLALTVDHGLRPEAAEEAAWVKARMQAAGISHETLHWSPQARERTSQQGARQGRYARLTNCCAARAILHLVFAHHQDDQAETVLLRIRAQTGPDGLSGMAGVRHLPDLRVLRPLLDVPKARLIATLAAWQHPYIADPSNDDPKHERVHLRQAMPALAELGVTTEGLADFARCMGHVRERLDRERNEVAARAVVVHNAGYADLDLPYLLAQPEPIASDVIARVLRSIGGGDHLPRSASLSHLMTRLRADPMERMTLGGCIIQPYRRRWLVCREAGRTSHLPWQPPQSIVFDGRFTVCLAEECDAAPSRSLWIGALGARGWASMVQDAPHLRDSAIPSPVRPSLPALFDDHGVVEVPHLAWRRRDESASLCQCSFAPRRAVAEAAFTVAHRQRHII